MNDKIIVCILAASLLHEVKICNACVAENATKVIAMCTVNSVTGSTMFLTTSNAAVNTCVCTIEASSGPFVITNTAQPKSPDCGTRIDITNKNGIISTTFQCQQLQLFKAVGVYIVSGDITFHKQSNSTEDDIRYCLYFAGPSVTISCYGTDSQPPTITATETTPTTSTTTVRSSTTTSTTKVPTTFSIIATPATTRTHQSPSKSLPTSSSLTSKHTTLLTLSTTNHQGDNADMNVVVIIAATLSGLFVTGVVIVVIFLCQSYLKNANKKQTEDERNDSYANLSNDREGNLDYETLNNMQIISVSAVTVMYENVAC